MRTFARLFFGGTMLLIVIMFLLPAKSWALDACYTGSWYDPAAPGEGISVEVLEDQVLVYFYREDGEWFALQGSADELVAYQPWAGEIVGVGWGFLLPVTEDSVVFAYDLLLDIEMATPRLPIPWCLRSDCADEKKLTRLTQPIDCG